MTIRIGSDIHGAYETLFNLLDPSDTLILLGDYLDFLNYDDLTGMIAEFVPRETIRTILQLISDGEMKQAKVAMGQAMGQVDDLMGKMEALTYQRYEKLFAGLKCETYIIWGNVDNPKILKEMLTPNVHLVENDVLEIDDKQCGFVSGTPPMKFSFGMPGELTRKEFRDRLYGLGPVDYLFVHPPPTIPELTYDTWANRDEEGSDDLLAYIDAYQPKAVYFGHVHHPKKQQILHKDTTELINVGFFQKTKQLVDLD